MRLKEFLKEDNGLSKISLVLNLRTSSFGLELKDSAVKSLKEFFNDRKTDITFSDNLHVEFLELSRSDVSHKSLASLYDNTVRIVAKSLNSSSRLTVGHFLLCMGMPTFPVSYHDIVLYAQPNMNLIGINKFIMADEFQIDKCENITGYVLSVLKVDSKSIFLSASENIEWMEIVNKYLASNRDIIDCQEELIEAGFKEYAKL
jgi:hypothetical protein